MAGEKDPVFAEGTREANFSRGLRTVEFPEFGQKIEGKVRDNWVVPGTDLRVMFTSDRTSAYDSVIATVPGKGQVLNLLSAFWFNQTRDIVPNHLIDVPHPNITIAQQAVDTLPVEVVVRKYMARSSTTTSIYRNYSEGRRNIYGIDFPEGLQPNQELPEPIITPTTKAETGHDEMLTIEDAKRIVDTKLGWGVWDKSSEYALKLFERGTDVMGRSGLLLVDTKYEFGINKAGKVMVIDEMHSPDSSRIWKADSYHRQFVLGKPPESFDKEMVRSWLAEHGFKGEGAIPQVDPEILDRTADAYKIPYRMIVGSHVPEPFFLQPTPLVDYTSQADIRRRTLDAVTRLRKST